MSELPEIESSFALASSGNIKPLFSCSEDELLALARRVPTHELAWPAASRAGVNVWLRRDDLLHPVLSGNKFYKLWGHLRHLRRTQPGAGIVSCGGAFSNHLHALAYASRQLDIKADLIVRGQAAHPSPTIQDAVAWGATVHFVHRDEYPLWAEPSQRRQLLARRGISSEAYWIPEGGGGRLGQHGCALLGQALSERGIRHCLLASGTGTTMSGILNALPAGFSVTGISALSSGASVTRTLLVHGRSRGVERANWALSNQYHRGGFGRVDEAAAAFMRRFLLETGVQLDKVYTVKLFMALEERLARGFYQKGSELLVMHSGGLQGNRSGSLCAVAADSTRV